MASDDSVLERAKGYPYWRPPTSFIFINDKAYTFSNASWPGTSELSRLLVSDGGHAVSVEAVLRQREVPAAAASPNQRRTPILAIGSNAGVSQLQRKFPVDLFPAGVVIPVVQSLLLGFDVVYAPLIASYGSVVATLQASPGTAVELFVTFLTDQQLEHMHSTEGGYNLLRLNAVDLRLGQSLAEWEAGQPPADQLSSVLVYTHQVGSLCLPLRQAASPSPVALEELKSAGRVFPALSQSAIQQALHFLCPSPNGLDGSPGQRCNPDRLLTLQRWFSSEKTEGPLVSEAETNRAILRNVADRDLAARLSRQLEAAAVPLQYADLQVLAALSDDRPPSAR
eukprot:EG_transcript_13126